MLPAGMDPFPARDDRTRQRQGRVPGRCRGRSAMTTWASGSFRFLLTVLFTAVLVSGVGFPAAAQGTAAVAQDAQLPTTPPAVNALNTGRACDGCPPRRVGMSLL